MEEQQVTIEGETRPLKKPFFVIATQNPLEHSGTFPLPESQLDRFLMRITLGYPDRAAEKRILKGEGAQAVLDVMNACMVNDDVFAIQADIGGVHASDAFIDYLQDIIQFTRASSWFHVGLSPRAGLALQQASRAWAYMEGRDYMIPEDLQVVLPWVVGHRLRASSDGLEISQHKLMKIFSEVPVPPLKRLFRPRTDAAREPDPLPLSLDRHRVYILPRGTGFCFFSFCSPCCWVPSITTTTSGFCWCFFSAASRWFP
jgi:MoxR-like ATPase